MPDQRSIGIIHVYKGSAVHIDSVHTLEHIPAFTHASLVDLEIDPEGRGCVWCVHVVSDVNHFDGRQHEPLLAQILVPLPQLIVRENHTLECFDVLSHVVVYVIDVQDIEHIRTRCPRFVRCV